MSMSRSASRAGALLIPLALVLAACSGGTGASGAPSAAASNAAATAAPSTGLALPSGLVLPSGLDLPSGLAIPSFDLSQLVNGLEDHTSYQVSVTSGGTVTYKATVVNKPVKSRDVVLGGDSRVVVIGDQAWTGDVGGKLTPTQAGIATQMFALYDPSYLIKAYSAFASSANAADKGTETKNGVNTHHYRIDSTTFLGVSPLPADASIDVWVADEGYVASVVVAGLGSDFSIDVTNVDDPANKVETPS